MRQFSHISFGSSLLHLDAVAREVTNNTRRISDRICRATICKYESLDVFCIYQRPAHATLLACVGVEVSLMSDGDRDVQN